MTINEIVEMIENEYGETCAEAEMFRESGEMWNYCMEVVKDHNKLNCIIFANDMGIPPIKSFLEFYTRDNGKIQGELDCDLKKGLLNFWNFVFRHCLDYRGKDENCKIKTCGIKMACRYTYGPKCLVPCPQ